MLIGGIALGLVLGLLAGGSLPNLASIQLRRTGLLVVAVLLRFGTEFLLGAGIAVVEPLRLPLYAASFGLLLYALWANRRVSGHEPRLRRHPVERRRHRRQRRLHADLGAKPDRRRLHARPTSPPALHYILPPALDANFLLHLGPLADVIPIPLP